MNEQSTAVKNKIFSKKMPENINRPFQYRKKDKAGHPSKANDVLVHRAVAHRDELQYTQKADQSVDITYINQDQRLKEIIMEKYPNLKRALWLFERGKAAHIQITSAKVLYRDHIVLDYTADGTERKVVLKKTSYARTEKIVSSLMTAVGLDSFRVLSIDGGLIAGYDEILRSHWKPVSTKARTEEDGYLYGDIPFQYSSYAVIEYVDGQTVSNFEQKPSKEISKEQAIKIVKKIGAHYLFSFIFGVKELDKDHLIVNFNSNQVFHIDLELALAYFTDVLFLPQNVMLGLSQQENAFYLKEGALEFLGHLKKKVKLIEGIIKRNAKIFIELKMSTKILSEDLIEEIDLQIKRAERQLRN